MNKESEIILCVQYFKSVISQQIYKQRMLDKYQSFIKLSKSPECTIYTAFNRQSAQNVLIKRISTRLTWNEMLVHRDIQIINKSKIVPKMTEIFKYKGLFFIALQKPSANSLSLSNSVEKINEQTFYQLFSEFLQGLRDIQTQHANTKLVPEWIFFHRNSLKLVHFENFLVAQNIQKKHVITYGKEPENPEFDEKNEQQTDFTPQRYKMSIVFNLGLVAFRLLTGKKQEQIASKQKYEEVVANIRQNCQRQIVKITGDSKLASFITKMLADNYFQVPSFNAVCNFFQARVREKQKLKMFKDRTMDIQLEKIHIGINKQDKQQRIKLRRCCVKEQKINQKTTKEKMSVLKQKLGMQSSAQILSTRKNILVLPYLSTNRNYSCLNRHNPLLSNSNRLKTTIKDHIKSSDYTLNFDD